MKNWEDSEDFLKQLAIKKGKLKKGGEPDTSVTAKLVLVDWQRGGIPYYHLPEGEIDKMDVKKETIDDIKEEDFLKRVGAPEYQRVAAPEIEDVDEVDEVVEMLNLQNMKEE